MKHRIILCECSSTEHQVIFHHDDDGDLFMSVHLQQSKGLWYRIKAAVKYIFGYRSRYGHWDALTIGPESIPEFEEIVKTLKIKQNAI